jgi:hypothetical protein
MFFLLLTAPCSYWKPTRAWEVWGCTALVAALVVGLFWSQLSQYLLRTYFVTGTLQDAGDIGEVHVPLPSQKSSVLGRCKEDKVMLGFY